MPRRPPGSAAAPPASRRPCSLLPGRRRPSDRVHAECWARGRGPDRMRCAPADPRAPSPDAAGVNQPPRGPEAEAAWLHPFHQSGHRCAVRPGRCHVQRGGLEAPCVVGGGPQGKKQPTHRPVHVAQGCKLRQRLSSRTRGARGGQPGGMRSVRAAAGPPAAASAGAQVPTPPGSGTRLKRRHEEPRCPGPQRGGVEAWGTCEALCGGGLQGDAGW